MSEPDTRTRLLDIGLELVQTRGYNSFSFHDLAMRMGIKTPSVHYHFPTKADLGRALVQRHRQVLAEAFAHIDADEPDAWKRLQLYAQVFRSTLRNGHRMCLGGMLAIDYQTLPADLVAEVQGFFEDNELWLARTLRVGRKAGVVVFVPSATEVARTLFAALEGAMLAARAFGDFSRFDTAAAWHLGQLKA